MSGAQQVGSTEVQSAKQLFAEGGGDRGFQYLMASTDEERAELIADGALEYEEWKTLKDVVVENRNEQVNLVNDLREAGLTTEEDLATWVSRWQTMGDISEDAEIGMNPEGSSDEEDPGYGLDGVPLPCVWKNWRIDRRILMTSRRGPGGSLDTKVPSQATRSVNSTFEKYFINGWKRPIDGYEMHGFTNHPDRNQVAGSNWYDDTTDAEDIRGDFLSVVEALEDDEFDDGGYWAYVNRNEYQRLRRIIADFGSGNPGDTNMRERILDELGDEISRIRKTKHVPPGEAVIFQPTRDVVELGVAEEVQPIEWESPSGWTLFMKIFGAANLQLASTEAGQMGVAHLTGLSG